jgi:hypothetical protein
MSTSQTEALIQKLEKGRAKTHAIYSSLTEGQWAETLYEEPHVWTLRDLLAHFISAEERLLEIAQDVVAGGEGAPEDFDFDVFNQEELKRLEQVPPDELLSSLSDARQTTLDWVRTLNESQLQSIGRHPVLGNVPVETIIISIYHHQIVHMRDVLPMLV